MAAAAKSPANEPIVGIDVGAALPISDFRDTADPGGAIAPFVGYRIGHSIALIPMIQPQLVALATDDDAPSGGDVTSLFSITAGGRLSLSEGSQEVYIGAQGGYYTDLSGPIDGDAGGFNISAGFNYEFQPGTALGLYIRRDQALIDAAPGNDSDLTFLVTGLSFQHRFLPPPPPPPVPVVAQAPPPTAPEEVKKKIVLRGVNFDFDKAAIRPDARPILDEAARALKEESAIEVSVEGHTDSIGGEAYNEKLSLRRAEAVREYLAAQGIDPNRMQVRGLGEAQPVASNDTAEGRAQNRRVELRVEP